MSSAVNSLSAFRHRSLVTAGIIVTVGALVAGILLDRHAELTSDLTSIQLWTMVALAMLAGSQAFVATESLTGQPVVICPAICFTFAALLCFGLGTALAAQVLTSGIVAWKLRQPLRDSTLSLGQHAVAFAAAAFVLDIGRPNPLAQRTPEEIAMDAASVVVAIGVWLAAYAAFEVIRSRLGRAHPQPRSALANKLLFTVALLLISPILAVTAHIYIGFVPLVFVPLYAVQRMAKLSAQRDRAARVDPLTGLANRTGLKAASNDLSESLHRTDRRPALLIADLDEFKHINDSLGHEVGDQLLVAVTRRLARLPLHPGGVIARLGGDEFAIVDAARDAGEAQALANNLVSALAEPIVLGGVRVDITASIGIAVQADEHEDFATLLRHADIAMYDAKKRGNSTAEYRPDSHHDSVERLALLTDFRRALETGDRSQISLHYQPQVRLATGAVEGVEALLRWYHPRLGLIDTQEIISMAEHSSVMHLLTLRVIDEVVTQMGAWAAEGIRLRGSINVSSRDLYDDTIASYLASRLSHSDAEPGQIQLEITEGALLGDPYRAMGTISRVRNLGVEVSLDDFGTGYSSLQHLRKLPINEIKIDRSFVGGMANNHDDAAIVRSTVELGRSLGLRTVAEGVENEYTRRLLAEAGCTLAQGWLTAHPMTADEFRQWWYARTPAAQPTSTPS